MRVVEARAWGGLDQLALGERPDPAVTEPDQVLIEVAAAGLNFADSLIIAGKYQERPLPPFVPGFEVAGRVLAVGAQVRRVKQGDRVMAVLDQGGYAEQALAREADCFPIPPQMDFATAAAFAIAYGTSHIALDERAALEPGERLLVLGASGGVGLTAVEIGKAMGATVIACAGGPEKLAIARAHGADHLIDYKTETLRQRVKEICDGGGVDVVYDPVGGDLFDQALKCTNWGGRLLIVGFAGGGVPQIPANYLLVKNLAALGIYWGSYRRKQPALVETSFHKLFAWHREGKLKPLISNRFDLAEAATALELLTSRRATGKVVLITGRG
ncbi:MAG TPA: NADPH:quinone oxidoreductase family protein [Hypericibacter adhaerens]|jgi:NADPH2:quinone reductase|uniref:NADPH:quinone oxidoreductase n=1 Tax=Hypericibacter adhaerens TaxID=2602016 RepID=A0A5J6N669_9PROT|nr:NADPH:quinone oxidoreductase family protein [Hypericibacter adhaerens]QEX24967.1 NADPH:quinone oxidoreductase [Hypericibacter adhaerens]HWA42908.1 NADPH:quinone oxidoreductase family protein [Hypericibacter adhaerens]